LAQHQDRQIKNFYRFGVPEKSAFKEETDTYYGVTVSAHMAVYYSTSMKEFLRTLKKPFFVDPMTYVFARDPENIKIEGRLRKSYRKLSECYGKTIEASAGRKPLDPQSFTRNNAWNTEVIDEIVNAVLSCQKELLKPSHVSILKYAKILGEEVAEEIEAPEFLVAPYFYAATCDDAWYAISLECARRAKILKGKFDLYPVICISKEILLDLKAIQKIKDDYKEFDGLVFWVSSTTNEENNDPRYLEGLKNFVKVLAQLKKPLYSLYGGYFTALLSKYGLTGYSAGICYGENRQVDARTTGGGQPRRYYIPFSHTKVLETDARTFFSDTSRANYKLLCSCDVCSDIKNQIVDKTIARQAGINPVRYVDEFFSSISMVELRRHFMACRQNELEQITGESLSDSRNRLAKEYQNCEKSLRFPRYPNLGYQHLKEWSSMLA